MTESEVRTRARKLHEQLLRDDPKYREAWEKVDAMFRTVLADIDLRDEKERIEQSRSGRQGE